MWGPKRSIEFFEHVFFIGPGLHFDFWNKIRRKNFSSKKNFIYLPIRILVQLANSYGGVHEIFFEKKNYLDFIPVIKMYAQIVKKNPVYFDVAPMAWS